ncbi:hypothetical protein [Streptomyces sp. NPDC048172]|uniref:hypothetical protein n=1 Tax=Streptomyces sp. NPDC048172 TaxID=3365505 RepID=UPI003715A842
MHLPTAAVFGEAPVIHLLGIAAEAQGPARSPTLDDELARLDRTIGISSTASWALPMSTLAALLELIADILEADPAHDTPPAFRAALERAAEGTDPPGYLRTLAGLVRLDADRQYVDHRELRCAPWETDALFPRLQRFGNQWLDARGSGDGAGAGHFAYGVRQGIEHIHADLHGCPEQLAALGAEAQRMLLLFPTPRRLRDNVRSRLHWATQDTVRTVLTQLTDHMDRHHAQHPD